MLFADVTFGIYEGDKIGVVAKNGTGKTSLLKLISGADAPDSGNVIFREGLRVAMLDQTPSFAGNPTVLEASMSADTPVGALVRSYEKAMAEGDVDAAAAMASEMDALNAWDYEDRARRLLTQLRIDNLSQRVDTLSGGQLKRIALCRILLDSPDVLILDEPTNHLDIDTIEWLENYLGRSRATLLMVTHDRYFLDRVCNKIIEIDNQTIYTYEGNFDYYIQKRSERLETMAAELAKVKNTLRKETDWMRRQPQARAGKAKYRIDRFYDLKERSMMNLKEENIRLNVKSGYIGSKIFEAAGVNKSFGEKVVLKDFEYIFSRYEKVGIIGESGVGKSSFVKLLQGILTPDSGTIELGETVRFGYYSQEGIQFDENKKVIDAITEIAEDITINDGIRLSPMQFLNHFLFSPADQQKYIYTLSGGERARLHLATVLIKSPNFLILDEPTNDLDIVTLGLLEEYLSNFKGCLIIISHDRFFLDSIVDHLFVFRGNGVIKDFPGTYTEYRDFINRSASEASAVKETERKSDHQRPSLRQRKLTYKEQKELEALTLEIATLEKEKAEIEAVFAGERSGDFDACSRRYDEVKNLLDEKELRWLELSDI